MGPDISLSRARDLDLVGAIWWGGVAKELVVVADDIKAAKEVLREKDSSDWVSNDTKDLGYTESLVRVRESSGLA